MEENTEPPQGICCYSWTNEHTGCRKRAYQGNSHGLYCDKHWKKVKGFYKK